MRLSLAFAAVIFGSCLAAAAGIVLMRLGTL
jgi:hypothetical protein